MTLRQSHDTRKTFDLWFPYATPYRHGFPYIFRDLSNTILETVPVMSENKCLANTFALCRKNRPNYRGMYPTAAKALGRCCCRLGALHLEPAMSILPRHARSEERRVGKECRSRWSADH